VRGGSHFLCTGVPLALGFVRVTPFGVHALPGNLLSSRSISSPLCGAAVTFFAAAKKVTKESSYGASGVRRKSH